MTPVSILIVTAIVGLALGAIAAMFTNKFTKKVKLLVKIKPKGDQFFAEVYAPDREQPVLTTACCESEEAAYQDACELMKAGETIGRYIRNATSRRVR